MLSADDLNYIHLITNVAMYADLITKSAPESSNALLQAAAAETLTRLPELANLLTRLSTATTPGPSS